MLCFVKYPSSSVNFWVDGVDLFFPIKMFVDEDSQELDVINLLQYIGSKAQCQMISAFLWCGEDNKLRFVYVDCDSIQTEIFFYEK